MLNWLESKQLLKAIGAPPRHKGQINRPFEADCEITRVGSTYWGCSTDGISEEVSSGLYQYESTWGWISAVTSVSDLAACALKPIGILLASQWPARSSLEVRKIFSRSFNLALRKVEVPLLGGDTGTSLSPLFTTSIFGSSKVRPLTRMGVRKGDWVLLLKTHPLGVGPMLGISWLLKKQSLMRDQLEKRFRPRPDWKAMQRLRPWVEASIDTSDGITTSLGIIAELNQVGFDLFWNPELVNGQARAAVRALGLPSIVPLLGDHGDFHILLFVSDRNLKKVLSADPRLTVIGQAVPYKSGMHVVKHEIRVPLLYRELMSCPRDTTSLKKMARYLMEYYAKVQL